MKKHIIIISVFATIWSVYSLTAPQNHSEAEDVYDFAQKVEQGTFADQAGVNRMLALPLFSMAYKGAQLIGYSGRAFPVMIFLNRLLAVVALFLFSCLLQTLKPKAQGLPTPPHSTPKAQSLIPNALLLAFSYGFWRYANEAETYMLAAFFMLAAWYSVAKGKWLLAVLLSAVGILVHLLNLIPLLLIIPLYYLLSKEWKKAFAHGGIVGLLVLVGYSICSPYLNWGELGAQHHSAEAGMGFGNFLRGGIAFGQCLVSGNFLFGFESFRDLLVQLFPSRMLDEEFYMATQMPGWIKWAGCISLGSMGVWGLLRCRQNVDEASSLVAHEQQPKASSLKPTAFFISCVAWLLLYAVAILRTESGSPELWIMALVPFWFVVGRWLKGRWAVGLVVLIFAHNLIAGLFPVMSEETDYHATKGRWLVENSTADDLILTSYEPVMIFYLDYFASAQILNSGAVTLEEIQLELGREKGTVYALSTFFQPLESMRVRSPVQYGQMLATGEILFPRFGRVVENEFGGIYELR